MWFVYVLLCSDSSLYTGVAKDVRKRFESHMKGEGARYTRSHKPLKMVFTEEFDSRSSAQKREAEIKKWSRSKKIEELNIRL